MDEIKLLLIVNSVLLTTIGTLFLVLGFFLKDLHKDFKELIVRVNQLYIQFESHLARFDTTNESIQDQLERMDERISNLENTTNK